MEVFVLTEFFVHMMKLKFLFLLECFGNADKRCHCYIQQISCKAGIMHCNLIAMLCWLDIFLFLAFENYMRNDCMNLFLIVFC